MLFLKKILTEVNQQKFHVITPFLNTENLKSFDHLPFAADSPRVYAQQLPPSYSDINATNHKIGGRVRGQTTGLTQELGGLGSSVSFLQRTLGIAPEKFQFQTWQKLGYHLFRTKVILKTCFKRRKKVNLSSNPKCIEFLSSLNEFVILELFIT